MIEPGIHGAEWLGVEPINAIAAVPAFLDKAGAAQEAEMLGNGGAGNGEGQCNPTSGEAAATQEVKYGAARRIGERAEDRFRGICNRTVTHNA